MCRGDLVLWVQVEPVSFTNYTTLLGSSASEQRVPWC